ncbi:hypothetical protein [Synechococcus sp. M16CYN]
MSRRHDAPHSPTNSYGLAGLYVACLPSKASRCITLSMPGQ